MKTTPLERAPPKVLVIDVGGSHVKCLASGETSPRRFASGPRMTAEAMTAGVLMMTTDWRFDVVSMGYPGVVRDGSPAREPHNLGPGWVGFDFEAAFGRPVKVLNDAAMQALGAYRGGMMLQDECAVAMAPSHLTCLGDGGDEPSRYSSFCSPGLHARHHQGSAGHVGHRAECGSITRITL